MEMNIMPTPFEDVKEFQVKFGQVVNTRPTHLSRRLLAERANFMLEELLEFGDAADLYLIRNESGRYEFQDKLGTVDQNMEGLADALQDLKYVAYGTEVMMGLPSKQLWDDVHAANMRKVRGARDPNGVLKGNSNIGKPPGWVGPDTDVILMRAGYHRDNFITPEDVVPIDDSKCCDGPGDVK